ncbi:hypothetical protein B0I35DRAFT_506579 [Stachybotrys elegans]|uniref:DUF6546 domain-containing protein n=1 Tax=Stachybotrys elegans TaxID=80388 RepID=A0A8K0WXP1_9HYPO|nr:hypothetical protein B0I35DRAFT_506579 [Stachybotrys elegans]
MATKPVQDKAPSIAKAGSWASLPSEVRQTILGLVSSSVSEKHHNSLDQKAATLATVCWEWQSFFEALIFRRLVVDPDSLGDFDVIIRRRDIRLGYIRKLWLRVQLSSYECPRCDEPEDEATQLRNNTIFTDCIHSLLGTLKLWDPARHGPEGLALMLSACSPSDTEHRFSRCEIKDDYPFHYAEDLGCVPGIVQFHRGNIDAYQNYFNHRDTPTPWLQGHAKRMRGTPLLLLPRSEKEGRFISDYGSLPAVPIIKGLVIRRQFRRDLDIRSLSCLLGQSFTALEWFRLERTISPTPRAQTAYDRGILEYLLPSLPKTLHRFSLTQWEIPRRERVFVSGLGEQNEEGMPPFSPDSMAHEMAKLSQRVEHFCPPWQMDSAAFLRSIIELGDRSRHEFESLVILAAEAALSLPQLQVLELWGTCLHGGESRAYIFRYTYQDGRATITWRGCEETTAVPQTRVIAGWSEVAKRRSSAPLTYHAIPITKRRTTVYLSDGACIYQDLLLKELLLDPLTQIFLENEPRGWTLGMRSNPRRQGDALYTGSAVPNLSDGSDVHEMNTIFESMDNSLHAVLADMQHIQENWEAALDTWMQRIGGIV